jgi:geranylgeranyl diphosphate synthase, type I
MDFSNYLKASAEEIDQELQEIFKKWRTRAQDYNPKLNHLVEEAIEATSGGKRLRGTLVKLGFDLARGDGVVNNVAAAVEIFQTSLLIHDDIVDQSKSRRGRVTTYRKLGGDHYGKSQALTLGDAGFFLGFNILLKSDFPPELKEKALRLFNDSLSSTSLGQLLDIEVPHSKEVLERDIMDIYYLKTAHYTFIGPLLLGASLGGGSDELVSLLEEFGKNLGIAFQIQDDILGVFGEEDRTGKSATSDIEEGKATLLLSYALDKANSEQKKILGFYGKGQTTDKNIKEIREVFTSTGALDYARQTALDYTDRAKGLILKIATEDKMQNLLTQMADFLIKREK